MNTLKNRLAFGCLALGCSAAALAQSSGVQLSGQIGSSVSVKTHQGAGNTNQVEVTDNTLWTSYLRMSGVEDLGGGMKAMFRLEQALIPDTGNAGGNGVGGNKLWNRQSWVGLQFGAAGTVTLGRQFHASTDRAIRTLDVHQLAGSALHVTPMAAFGVNRFSNNDNRVDNSVKYRVTVPKVIEFGASVGAGEGTTGSSYSVDVAHGNQNYEVGAMYVHYDANDRLANLQMPQLTLWAIGGNVKLGAFRPYLSYFDGAMDSIIVGRRTQKNKIIDVGLAWDITPVFRVTIAGYLDTGKDLNGIAGRDGKKHTYVVGGYYALSKRTELNIALFDNAYTDGYKQETLNIAALNRNPSASSTGGMSLGIRHLF